MSATLERVRRRFVGKALGMPRMGNSDNGFQVEMLLIALLFTAVGSWIKARRNLDSGL